MHSQSAAFCALIRLTRAIAEAACFRQRINNEKDKKSSASLFDYALFIVASLNAVCHVSAAFSRQLPGVSMCLVSSCLPNYWPIR